MKTIIFLENENDINIAEKYFLREDILIIALSFEVTLILDAKNISYKYPHNYISSKQLENSIIDKSFLTIKEICNKLNNMYNSELYDAIYYPTKVLYDSIVHKIIHIDLIIEKEKPDEVMFFSRNNCSNKIYGNMIFTESEDLYSMVIKLFEKKYDNIKFIKIKRINTFEKTIFFLKIKNFLRKVYKFYKNYKQSKVNTNKEKIIILDTGRGLDKAYSELSNVEKIFYEIVDPIYYKKVEFKLNSFDDLLMYKNIDFSSIFKLKFETILGYFNHYYSYFSKSNIFDNVNSIFSLSYSNIGQNLFSRIARKKGITIISYSHLGYGHYDMPIVNYIDGVMVDHKLVGGEKVVDFINKNDNINAEIHSAGLIMLDDLKKQLLETNKTNEQYILYSLFQYRKNNYIFSKYFIGGTEQFELHKKILAILNTSKEKVILKTYPNQVNQNKVIREIIKNYPNIILDEKIPLKKLYRNSKVIIVDILATSLFEILITDSKVVCYSGIQKFSTEGEKLLKERVSLYDNIEEYLNNLLYEVETTFDNKNISMDFIKSYGLGKENEKAYITTRNILTEIIERKSIE